MSHALPFEHFRDAKARRRPAWAAPLFAGCAIFTAAMLFGMWVKSVWAIEELEHPKHSIDLAVAPTPPPPPPPLAGGSKPVVATMTPKKPTVRDIVQPVHIDKESPRPTEPEQAGDPNGSPGGQPGGTGVDPNGVVDPNAVPLPPVQVVEPPKPTPIVPPGALEASRIAGEKQIEPDDVTKTEIQRSGQSRLSATFKVCLTASGSIATVTMLKSSKFSAYDHKIESTISNTWRYRPFLVGGTPTPVCTAVTFMYSQI
jgi:hypothetical protein